MNKSRFLYYNLAIGVIFVFIFFLSLARYVFFYTPIIELKAWCYSGAKPGDTAFYFREGAFRALDEPLSQEFRSIVAARASTSRYGRIAVDKNRIWITASLFFNYNNEYAQSKTDPYPSKHALFNLTNNVVEEIIMKRNVERQNSESSRHDAGNIVLPFPKMPLNRNCEHIKNFATKGGKYARDSLEQEK